MKKYLVFILPVLISVFISSCKKVESETCGNNICSFTPPHLSSSHNNVETDSQILNY